MSVQISERNRAIENRYLAGETLASMSAEFGLHLAYISRLMRSVRGGNPDLRARARQDARAKARQDARAKARRTLKMAEMYRQGVTLEKIGQTFGVTRERVRQIIGYAGLTGKDGGQAQVTLTRVDPMATKVAARNAKYIARHGMTYDAYMAVSVKVRTAYRHRVAAEVRRVAVHLGAQRQVRESRAQHRAVRHVPHPRRRGL